MRSNYVLTVEDSFTSSSLALHCTLRQANKAFISLSYALTGNLMGYRKISLFVVARGGVKTKINTSTFNGLVNE